MPRFVILEHHWNGVHWDIMLEEQGLLRTWAVDSPIRPGVDLPARALPGHRLDYLDYEGPVSGDRGSVRRWDRGLYQAVAWGPERVRVALEGTQLVGELELRTAVEGEPSAAWVCRFGNAI